MSDLYPFLMSPAFDPRPWGTLDLSPIYPNHRFSEKIGESWLTGDDCKIANGPLRGKSLSELSKTYGVELVGSAARDPYRFPLLLKFLFPNEKLSVQVHPDDHHAKQVGEPCGKTECWYIAHAKPGSQIALGLKNGTTRASFEEAIHQQRAEELLHWINVYQGEMIYVPGGTVHTLGPGSVIVETQQQSDTTYRLYDYGRPRELHLDRGLAVMKEKVEAGKVIRPAPTTMDGTENRRSPLVSSPCFLVELLEMKDSQVFRSDAAEPTSAQILVAVDGAAVVEASGYEAVTFAKGDAIVIPACLPEYRVRPQWTLQVLKARLPGHAVPEPAIRQ